MVNPAMAYVPPLGGTVLVGEAGTWTWDGEIWHAWEGETPAHLSYAAAYDPSTSSALVLGSPTRSRAYLWQGTGFVQVGETPALVSHADLATDLSRSRVVLRGGNTLSSVVTFEWDGTAGAFLEREVAGSSDTIPPWDGHALAYDARRQRVLLFGGRRQEAARAFDETWSWDGHDWLLEETSDPEGDGEPGNRVRAAMVGDAARGRVVLFGGRHHLGEGIGSEPARDTWLWDGGANARPGHLARIRFAEAEAPDGSTELLDVSLRWSAGGLGHPEGVDTSGAVLYVWEEGRWVELARHEASPDSPAALEWSATDPDRLERLFFGEGRWLQLLVTALAPNGRGDGYGALATDGVELTTRYRRQAKR